MSGLNLRTDSTSSPKNSILRGPDSFGGQQSITPPRKVNAPGSFTGSALLYPVRAKKSSNCARSASLPVTSEKETAEDFFGHFCKSPAAADTSTKGLFWFSSASLKSADCLAEAISGDGADGSYGIASVCGR
ncbi:MAG: hypothetical protein HY280_07015 [Nitrospinae bacterium]|nr:hypothetical protein [Nitrospinota bacterium]